MKTDETTEQPKKRTRKPKPEADGAKPAGDVAKTVLDTMQKNQVAPVDAEREDLISKCIEVIRTEKSATTSLLQRRLRLGYVKASEIMDELEKRGIVGPSPNGELGTATREILNLPKEQPKKKVLKPQRIETVLVRHDFTQAEIASLGTQLAAEQRVADQIQSEAKTCARQYKDKLETSKTKIGGLTDKIQEGYEMLPVEAIAMVMVNRGGETAKKVYYRKDTGDFIRQEDVLNAELELFNIIPDKTDVTKPLPKKLLVTQV